MEHLWIYFDDQNWNMFSHSLFVGLYILNQRRMSDWVGPRRHTAPEKFYVEPLQAPDEVLVIDRVSGDITLQREWQMQPREIRVRVERGGQNCLTEPS